MWEVAWLQERFHRFLAPAGAAKGTHVGPKLEACCGQVRTCLHFNGPFLDLEVELQLRRLLTSILGRFWGVRENQKLGFRIGGVAIFVFSAIIT